MPDNTPSHPKEDPRDRFRRLLEEAEKAEKDATIPMGVDEFPLEAPTAETEINVPEAPETPPDEMPTQVISEATSLDEQETEVLPAPVDPETRPDDMATAQQVLSETPPPPMLGTTPIAARPAVDERGMPLPRRVDEIDLDATRVTPAAYEPRTAPQPPPSQPPSPPPVRYRRPLPKQPVPSRPSIDFSRWSGCFVRMIILGLFVTALIGLIAGSFMLIKYYSIISAEDWPDVGELYSRTSQFETTRILDRRGNVLYEINDPSAGRRSYVSLDEISPFLVAATIATEDKEFYNHPGFDPWAIVRAFWQNLSSGETVSGASTITQQLGKALFISPEERAQGTYARKIKEALLAVELTRLFSKDEILELYLNEIYYGNLAYGIEAASQTYFGTSAKNLTLSQASFLSGLPQLPAVYDVYTNREATLARQQDVLLLMFQTSQEQGCIFVSNNATSICIEAGKAAEAAQAMENHDFAPPDFKIKYPHWVNFVRTQLESQFDPQTIYRSGFTVYTSLEPALQDFAQDVVFDQVSTLADRHVTNGALVAIRPATGEILAMVGSADFYNDAIDGQINMAISPRQPGSSIKPLTFLAAFERGWTPSTLIWDVRSEFPPSGDPNDPREPYVPVNYDERYHGPVTVRSALANSYNIPAVKALQYVGVYDDPTTADEDGLVAFARRLGITTLTRNDYGLSLTLGGGDVTLLEMAGAYAVFANGGRQIPPVAITRIEDRSGDVVYQYTPPAGEQVIRAEHAFLISSILSDNQARTPAFGPNSYLHLPFQVAAKTGTTNDFRDNWTVGYTPDVVVGTWVGNADYTPMQGTSGLTGAAPIWSTFINTAVSQITGGNPTPFIKPAGVIERQVCTISGTEPSQGCPNQRNEYFVADQLPEPKSSDLWQKVNIDTWTGKLASAACPNFTDQKIALNVTDPWAVKWIKDTGQGKSWAEQVGFKDPIFFSPTKTCKESDSRPLLEFKSPEKDAVIQTNKIKIFGTAGATSNFDKFELSYGVGTDPSDWDELVSGRDPINYPDELYEWDISEFPAGKVTLRLFVESTRDRYAETFLTLDLQVPTATPTETPTLTPTPTSTTTASPTLTPSITLTPTPTHTASATPIPTDTSTAEPSPTPTSTEVVPDTPTPTETPTPTPSP